MTDLPEGFDSPDAFTVPEPPAPPALRQNPERQRRTALVVAVIVLALCAAVGACAFAMALFSDEGGDSRTWLLTVEEEDAARAVALQVFEMGRRGDSAAFLALATGDPHVDQADLRGRFESTFATGSPTDYRLDETAIEVLRDIKTGERIPVIRMQIVRADGSSVGSGPIYLINRNGTWGITGLEGREVESAE